ncbi:MAG: S-adenosyl-l-methionine hydroxide adenosyltransferase family protein [Gloeobacteraceae cyanobacterium ES-bin-316]|nr:S-adenosyl-l-methionine hydroxide adenosyltransferase family protein [Ferruginibacter sp.]
MKNILLKLCIAILCSFTGSYTNAQNGILVLQTDFGLKDGAVSAMKGVVMGVDKKLRLFDLTHEIPAFNIWEASLRLEQAAIYWPKGTVFVSVVDPGVGSKRKSVVLQTKNGYFFVSPDNGTLTIIAEQMGIKELREIDEKTNRLPGSAQSYTFHGRDVFAYTAARLASGKISFREVGRLLPPEVVKINYQKPILEIGIIKGAITILDIQYGNAWSNIDAKLMSEAGVKIDDSLQVKIYHDNKLIYGGRMLFVNTFSGVPGNEPLGYLNSLLHFSIAINMGNFAEKHKIGSGPQWTVEIKKEE